MRLGPALASTVLVALTAGAGAAQAAPSAAFDLRPSRPCVAGECHALLSYGLAGLVVAVRVEVDWDTRNSPGGFQADDQLDCAPPLPEDLDDPVPCEADSPVFDAAGHRTGRHSRDRHRRRHAGDGGAAARRDRAAAQQGHGPRPRGSTPDLCAPSQPGVQCGPGNGRRTSGGGDEGPAPGGPR